MFEDGRDYDLAEPGALVVMLGDLGCLARDGRQLRRQWTRFAQEIVDAGGRPIALSPAAPALWTAELKQVWRIIQWDSLASGNAKSDADRQDQAERLLSLISPAVRIEPGLLRAVRCLLDPNEADAGTEADVWQHAALIGRSSEAGTIDPARAKDFRQRFSRERKDLRERVLALIRGWHAELPHEIWDEELFSLDAGSKQLSSIEAQLPAAHERFRQIEAEVSGGDPAALETVDIRENLPVVHLLPLGRRCPSCPVDIAHAHCPAAIGAVLDEMAIDGGDAMRAQELVQGVDRLVVAVGRYMEETKLHCAGGLTAPRAQAAASRGLPGARCLFGLLAACSCLNSGTAKADAVDPLIRREAVAAGGAQDLRAAVPGAAAQDAPGAILREPGAAIGWSTFIAFVIVVLAPFPNIPEHIVEPPTVRLFHPHGPRARFFVFILLFRPVRAVPSVIQIEIDAAIATIPGDRVERRRVACPQDRQLTGKNRRL